VTEIDEYSSLLSMGKIKSLPFEAQVARHTYKYLTVKKVTDSDRHSRLLSAVKAKSQPLEESRKVHYSGSLQCKY